jgi:hypothetical protein
MWAWQMRKIACEMMAQRQLKECSVILAINQNGRLRELTQSNELVTLSLCNDPISLCSLVADERVSLAELHGIVMPLPLDVASVTNLATGGNSSFDFEAMMGEQKEDFSS